LDGTGHLSETAEATMKKEIFQQNKARWEVLEQISSTKSMILWAIIAVVAALLALYVLA